jgi:hypothetical protein
MNVPSSTRFKELLEDEVGDGVGEWRMVLREGVESVVVMDIADERRKVRENRPFTVRA